MTDNSTATRSIVCSWSGGKDSMVLLEKLRNSTGTVTELLTNLNQDRNRVSMHGVKRSLIEHQADALCQSVRFVGIPEDASNDVYRTRMLETFDELADDGVDAVAYGDIHLEDVRSFREDLFDDTDLEPLFPLWGMEPSDIAKLFVRRNYRALTVCLDLDTVNPDCLGEDYATLLADGLGQDVDPCGENGEFHTFVFDGPMFDGEVSFQKGKTVTKNGFRFLDLEPSVSEKG